MSVVFFGTPHFAVPTLEALIAAKEDILAVITQPDKRQGRGHMMAAPPVKLRALEAGLPVLQPNSLRDEAAIEQLRALRPEFFVVVAYGKLLPKSLLDIPAIAPVNIHGSLLPRYRGAAPIAWAVLDCLKVTGITTMLMSEGLDEGDMLLKLETPIADTDTALSLGERLSHMGGPLLMRTLAGLRAGTITPIPQSGPSNYARQLRKEDGLIDWGRPARELDCHVRGMLPWPVAYFQHEGQTVKVLRARALSDAGASAGVVQSIMTDSITIGTGQGGLEIFELQPQGKRPMSGNAFAQGRRLKEGAALK